MKTHKIIHSDKSVFKSPTVKNGLKKVSVECIAEETPIAMVFNGISLAPVFCRGRANTHLPFWPFAKWPRVCGLVQMGANSNGATSKARGGI